MDAVALESLDFRPRINVISQHAASIARRSGAKRQEPLIDSDLGSCIRSFDTLSNAGRGLFHLPDLSVPVSLGTLLHLHKFHYVFEPTIGGSLHNERAKKFVQQNHQIVARTYLKQVQIIQNKIRVRRSSERLYGVCLSGLSLRCWSFHLHVVGDSMVVWSLLPDLVVAKLTPRLPPTLPSQSFVDQHL